MANGSLIEVLLIEDNEVDIDLTHEALEESKLANTLHVVKDGASALSYLRREPPYEQADPPDLVLLDLNLPKVSGHDVLEAMKSDPKLSSIPVVVLTSSDADTDVARTYAKGANAYVTKPVDMERFCEIVQAIEGFWLGVVRLPGR